MSRNSRRFLESAIRASFVLAIVTACFAFLFHSRSSSIRSANAIAQSEPPRHCPSCPPPLPRRIYAPAIELNEAQSCEIVLNSRSANPIDITPTFYTASGDAIVGNSIQLQPAEIRFVPVEQLMPESIRGTQRWGGIALSYTGNVLEVWAQITFHGPHADYTEYNMCRLIVAVDGHRRRQSDYVRTEREL